MQITRTALVLFPAEEMFRLVEDVEGYPKFLSWCTGSEVLEAGPGWQVASLDISIAGLSHTFTTRNELVPGKRLDMALIKGPFRTLGGQWRFDSLGEQGSKISLQLGFEFSGSLLSSAFERGFAGIADRLVNDFCLRAEDVYGQVSR